ncbi:16S rRNA (guanine1207-N2)-methyltransferase [Gordonia amarae]|nr:methyltransferase [Gordonia amarae]MCS3876428.1 16S rRNA (guanine1207-N2)-methyltransferase [Gordonia amarae]QHN19343.1 methyltransferase [Gordonia amarae]QHN23819.1 methyltransferase [Gordonia amarae]QHN32728.1 methyltransferase [Gordonia amarae]
MDVSTPPDRLILDEAAPFLDGPGVVVVIDDVDGALVLGAAAAGAHEIRVHQDLITGERSLASHAAAAGVTYRSMPLGPELLDGARVVLLRLPRSLDRLAEVSSLVATHAAPEVTLVAGGRIKHMTTAMNDVLRTVFDRVDVSLARQKSRVLIASGTRRADAAGALSGWPRTERHDDLGLTVAAHGGVFAGTRIDIGTRFLLGQLGSAPPSGTVVDLACGSGVIGTWLALRDPGLRVTATDRSAVAVASARATAEINKVADRITVTRADGLELLADSSESRIVLNPPFHNDATVSTEIARGLFADAGRVLAPDGELWCVWNSHLRYRPILERVVGPTRQLARNRKFTVTASVRR